MWVKICGVTSIEDAAMAIECGADAIGINLVPGSPRRVELDVARRIADAARSHAEVVGVVADLPLGRLKDLLTAIGFSLLQLHGNEPPDIVEALAPRAYKALRVGAPDDVVAFERYPGVRVLADSKVEGVLGGSGSPFDWGWVGEVARRRQLIVAGGLTADNVIEAVRAARPFGVDTASGVEKPGTPWKKDPERLRRFVEAAKRG